MRIATVTCRVLPEPDPDQPLLTEALETAGATVDVVPWDGEGYDWTRADLCVPRSTWNYYEDYGGFLAWAELVAAASKLVNPLEVVRWNTHKGYLLELDEHGVPTVPTVLLERGNRRRLASICGERGWNDVVVKPAVGAASWMNLRVGESNLHEGERHLATLVAGRDVLVQPYLTAVEDHGERSLVWIDGELTHSIRKEPRFGDADEHVSEQAIPPPDGAAALVEAALGVPPVDEADLLYARVDVVPDEDGELAIMELELVEPSLFFAQCPEALARFVAALTRRAD